MDRPTDPTLLLHRLGQTAERMERATQDLPAARLVEPPAPGEWSLNEILWHIRAQSDVYGEHISRILNEDSPAWRHVSPRARMKKSRYDLLPFAESFASFTRQRTSLVALLGSIAPEAWERFALVRVEKRESRLTLLERVWGMANHEDVHCHQFELVAAVIQRP
jgi:hypothetical protein